jgi:very-short-patch-repair endonuclease
MGITHANRIEESLNMRLRTEPDAREWFDRTGPEPYFIKNLERVQGDERDAIILAIGYGKSRGRMMHRFGPLNIAGGERRLNVAITRAKRHMTVVAGFHPDDLDASKLTADGARRLGDFLRYAAGDAVLPSSTARDAVALNPFEIQVRDRLRAVGIDVVCQLGVAGYFIDFAAKHPTKPGRMVLAIEADGAVYHSAPTTRSRDRLRQEQLERLGWRFHRTWSTDWFRNPDREVARIRAAYEAAVDAADRADARPALPAGDEAPVTASGAAASSAPGRPAETTDRIDVGVDVGADAGEHIVGRRRGPRPAASFGAPIADYSDAELLAIIEWITSDGLLRTDLELKQEARDELGFRRNGTRIEQRLSDAIDQARARRAAS